MLCDVRTLPAAKPTSYFGKALGQKAGARNSLKLLTSITDLSQKFENDRRSDFLGTFIYCMDEMDSYTL